MLPLKEASSDYSDACLVAPGDGLEMVVRDLQQVEKENQLEALEAEGLKSLLFCVFRCFLQKSSQL